jgi:hypothetical protein
MRSPCHDLHGASERDATAATAATAGAAPPHRAPHQRVQLPERFG